MVSPIIESSITVTNPQQRRIDNRQLTHSDWWNTPEWAAMKAENIYPDSTCCKCGYHDRERRRDRQGQPRNYKSGEPMFCSLTIHHVTDEKYLTFKEYLTFDEDCQIMCTTCHNRGHRLGMVICPVCKVNYIPAWDGSTECRDCYEDRTPGAREKRQENEKVRAENQRLRSNQRARNRNDKKRKASHPCKKRGLEQRCLRRPGDVCDYTAKKATDEKKGCPWLKKNPQWLRAATT